MEWVGVLTRIFVGSVLPSFETLTKEPDTIFQAKTEELDTPDQISRQLKEDSKNWEVFTSSRKLYPFPY